MGMLIACQPTWVMFLDTDLDTQLRGLIAARGLTGDPSIGREIPRIEEPMAQLGLKLFFTKALGSDEDSACASCHLPTLGGGDALSLPIGVGALEPDLIGPGRVHPSGGPTVPRNSPTTFNVALWDRVLFHDGRIESLGKTPMTNGADGLGIRTPDSPLGVADPQAGHDLTMAQARFPVTSPEEMRGDNLNATTNQDVRSYLATRLGNSSRNNPWVSEFEAIFGAGETIDKLITEQRIAQAIAAYERSQLFVETPWKAYVQGDNEAISPAAKRGAILFFKPENQGGAGCASCHMGDFFTDEQFHVLAIPQVGPGKGDGDTEMDDFGRFRETGLPEDLYAFRTPSLINVAVTAPYGHDGAYRTLEGIVRHHLNPAEALAAYDYSQLDAGVQTEYCVENTRKALAQIADRQPINLSNQDVDDLVAFLQALTDPCVEDPACLSPWMPTQSDLSVEEFRLIGSD
ncbi:cytochrome-c peroxidase [Chloroflexi bacterium TSY]|nr:cytochrome-c peroxidase [Chloroflexi bacterium TSY]